MDSNNYIFVYGTLRKDYDLKLKDRVREDLEYVGRAKVGGSLYDIGEYPGAVQERNEDEIIGDVFLITDPVKVFRILDKYEGKEFRRVKNKVKLRSGKLLSAWIYWYIDEVDGKQRIKHKDYLNYIKSKKTA